LAAGNPGSARAPSPARGWVQALVSRAEPDEDVVVYGGPERFAVGIGSEASITVGPGQNGASYPAGGDPWRQIGDFLDRAADAPVLGHLGSDLHRRVEPRLCAAQYPATWLMVPRLLFHVDAGGIRTLRGTPGRAWLTARPAPPSAAGPPLVTMTDDGGREPYEKAVRRVLTWIDGAADHRCTVARRTWLAHGVDVARLLRTSPMPTEVNRLFYIRHGKFEMAGNSPELLVDGRLDAFRSYKLSGTYPRISGPRDRLLRSQFVTDRKILAEHGSSLAAWRARLGRLGTTTSTGCYVLDLPRLRHLMTVLEVRPGAISPRDLLRATLPVPCFPTSGLGVLAEVEPFARGAYYGLVGQIHPDRITLSQVLRAVYRWQDTWFAVAGAAVTRDSSPSGEWFETQRKLASIGIPSGTRPW
jgi:salicylate synthetase